MTVLFCFVSKQLLLQSLSDMQGNTDLPHVALLRNPPLPASDIINGYDSRDGTRRKRAECISKFMVIVWRAERSADVTGLRLLDERGSLEGLWNISASSFLSMHCSTCLMEIILFEIVSSENRKRLLSVRQRDWGCNLSWTVGSFPTCLCLSWKLYVLSQFRLREFFYLIVFIK